MLRGAIGLALPPSTLPLLAVSLSRVLLAGRLLGASAFVYLPRNPAFVPSFSRATQFPTCPPSWPSCSGAVTPATAAFATRPQKRVPGSPCLSSFSESSPSWALSPSRTLRGDVPPTNRERPAPLNAAATADPPLTSQFEAVCVSDMSTDAASAVSGAATATVDRKAAFPPVTMDPDATQKFAEIVVRWDKESEEESVLIRGLAAAEYHVQAGEPTMDQLEKAGIEARITGGGRIKHDSKDKTIFIFGYSMQFGPADLPRVADMCRAAYPDYDVTFTKGGY